MTMKIWLILIISWIIIVAVTFVMTNGVMMALSSPTLEQSTSLDEPTPVPTCAPTATGEIGCAVSVEIRCVAVSTTWCPGEEPREDWIDVAD